MPELPAVPNYCVRPAGVEDPLPLVNRQGFHVCDCLHAPFAKLWRDPPVTRYLVHGAPLTLLQYEVDFAGFKQLMGHFPIIPTSTLAQFMLEKASKHRSDDRSLRTNRMNGCHFHGAFCPKPAPGPHHHHRSHHQHHLQALLEPDNPLVRTKSRSAVHCPQVLVRIRRSPSSRGPHAANPLEHLVRARNSNAFCRRAFLDLPSPSDEQVSSLHPPRS
jgi:hypothetical protein